jgi:hypothetical protein
MHTCASPPPLVPRTLGFLINACTPRNVHREAPTGATITLAAIAANTYNISWFCGVPVSWSPPIDYNGTVPDIWAKTPPFVFFVTFQILIAHDVLVRLQ